MARTPAAPRASIISRRLQSILRRIRENGIQYERVYVRKQLQQLSKLEDTMDGYCKGILQDIRSLYLKKQVA